MVANKYFSLDDKSKFPSLSTSTNPVLVPRIAWDVPLLLHAALQDVPL